MNKGEITQNIAREIINIYEKHNVKGFFSVEIVEGMPIIASVPNIPHDEIMARLRAIVEVYYFAKNKGLLLEEE